VIEHNTYKKGLDFCSIPFLLSTHQPIMEGVVDMLAYSDGRIQPAKKQFQNRSIPDFIMYFCRRYAEKSLPTS
jgi:hypothetical protein